MSHRLPGIFRYLRLYESAQILVPGMIGVLSEGRFPPLGTLVLYLITYAAHVLSVYSFNDLCDYETDVLNPRKADVGARSVRWLWYQTALLTALFLAGVVVMVMPPLVRLLLLLSQVVCMAYSHPRVRLKRRPLGSEIAHFTAGFSYYASGVLIAGGHLREHWRGGVVFGLLYLSGGTFNEIMDYDADRRADQRHVVVRFGRAWALAAVVAIHYAAFVLLAFEEPTLPVVVSCAAAALLYTGIVRNLRRRLDEPELLLRFRRRYRVLFAVLLALLSVSRLLEIARDAAAFAL